MIFSLIRRALDINWLAQLYLNRCAEKAGMFVCRGRIQLSLSSATIINLADEVCYIGTPLLGTSTPKNDSTVIVGGSNAIVSLNGCVIGGGVKLSVGYYAHLSIGNNSYITDGSHIATQNSITIGKNCAISFGVTIIDDDGHGFGLPPYSAPIVIDEDDVMYGLAVM